MLAQRLAQAPLQAVDVVEAAEFRDPVAVELLQRAARVVGETLATLVNFYKPALVLLGAASGRPVICCSPPSGRPSTGARCRWPPATCRSRAPR
jgi:predicted NBD/HSP70 family sugar kinase